MKLKKKIIIFKMDIKPKNNFILKNFLYYI